MSEITRLCALFELMVYADRSGNEIADRQAEIVAYVAAITAQRDAALEACKAARDWYGLDGDGISEPVLSQLKAAIYAAEASA